MKLSSVLMLLLACFSVTAMANSKPMVLNCTDGKNQATITFEDEILKDVCNDRQTEYPEITYTLNGQGDVWSPAPLYAMCAKPIKKTMLNFRKSIDESIYIEIAHDFSKVTASIRLLPNQFYQMDCH